MRVVGVSPSSKKDLLGFMKFPLRLYSDSPHYVPHLLYERKNFFNPRKNPFFEHAEVEYFLAISEKGEVVGRITAHIDWNYVDFQEEKAGFFGFFDCIDDGKAAGALLERAFDYHRKKGMESVLGPVSFSTNDEMGVLVRGFDSPPFIMMPYNYSYYGGLIEDLGLVKEKDLYAYYAEYDGTVPRAFTKVSGRVRKRSAVSMRYLDMKNFKSELGLVKEIYNSAWEKNWGFTPMTDREIEYLGSNLKQIVDPAIVFFAYVDDRVVGFFIALPDYNLILKDLKGRLFPSGIFKLLLGRKKINRMRVIVMGVIEEYRGSGIEAVMLDEIFRAGPEHGYPRGELSWILEDNFVMNKVISRIVKDPYKTYRVYRKKL